ncbi:tetratricopeptide repeat protein [Candidatus Azambacteria bacterium]|nr:tetratricopeptide repeat protein [Candidatus Azambacteria bacterium]
MEFYQTALIVNPKNKSTYISLGNVFKAQKRYTDALRCYKRCLSDEGNILAALINIAMVYDKCGKPSLARKYAKKALGLMKNKNDNDNDNGFLVFKSVLEKFI